MKLTEGLHHLSIQCPECGSLAVFPVEITARLTVDSDNGGRLAPKFSTKSADHDCNDRGGDPSLPFVDAEQPDEDDEDDPFDQAVTVELPA